jgi:DNA-binding NarL/FixJ family response regulator
MESRTRVLIADDQQPVREGLRCLLSLSSQVEVVGEAADGQDALHLVAERHPDVVLMDVQMPVMDGLEATRRIKDQWPGVRVVVLTIYARYRARAISAGADVFLLKGCSPEALQDAIIPCAGDGAGCDLSTELGATTADNEMMRAEGP